MHKIKQFEVWLANLEPIKGSEQGGVRPCVIMESNAVEGLGQTTIIAPITSKIEKIFSFDVIINPSKQNGLNKKSKIKIRQIRVADKSRLIKKIGSLEKEYYGKTRDRISLAFDLSADFENN